MASIFALIGVRVPVVDFGIDILNNFLKSKLLPDINRELLQQLQQSRLRGQDKYWRRTHDQIIADYIAVKHTS